jgi:hypothetical protein
VGSFSRHSLRPVSAPIILKWCYFLSRTLSHHLKRSLAALSSSCSASLIAASACTRHFSSPQRHCSDFSAFAPSAASPVHDCVPGYGPNLFSSQFFQVLEQADSRPNPAFSNSSTAFSRLILVTGGKECLGPIHQRTHIAVTVVREKNRFLRSFREVDRVLLLAPFVVIGSGWPVCICMAAFEVAHGCK